MSVEEYWGNFLKLNDLDKDTKYYDAFCFYGYTDEITDELTKLVLEGKKKATTSVFLEEETYPVIGSYSIVLDRSLTPVCIIKTTKTHILRFKDMPLELASKEGEGENLDSWFFDHSIVFKKEAEEIGYQFSLDMPIFFEEFEVVYKN